MDDPGEIDPPVVPEEGAVMLDEVGQIAPGLTARIAIAEMVAGVAQGPGEVAAEAVRLTIVVTNSAPEEASLRTAVVSTYFGSDRVPALELREPGGRPLPPAVDAMAETEGVYLFVVPEEDLDDVTIMVDYSVDAEPLVFRGSVAELMAS